MNPTIRIESDTATPALREYLAQLGPERFADRVGPAVQDLVRIHLGQMGPNALGYPSTGFYDKFVDRVQWLPQENGVAVVILPADDINGRQVGLRQHVFGGTIRPTAGRKMLAIPISPVSYGHVPSDFPGLFLLKTISAAFLCQSQHERRAQTGRRIGRTTLGGNAGRRDGDDLVFLFVLKASVTQEGKREALPSDEEILQTALNAAGRGLN